MTMNRSDSPSSHQPFSSRTDVLQKKTTDQSLKTYTVSILAQRTRSFEYTIGVVESLRMQVLDEVKRLGGNHILEAIVEGLKIGS